MQKVALVEISTLSIADFKLEEDLGRVPRFLYDVRARNGRCRLVECYSSPHKNVAGFDLAIFEFVREENLALFMEDEIARLKLIGELIEPFRPVGEKCALSLYKESEQSAALYYSILFEHFVFRMAFGFVRLENADPTELAQSLVEYFMETHRNIGLRT